MSEANHISVSSVAIEDQPAFFESAIAHWSRWRVIYGYGLFTFISNFGENIKVAPEIRLYELQVCRRYYQTHNQSFIDSHGFVDEKYCKLEFLQGELSMLQAWLLFWIYLVGLPVTIPLGSLADSIGRKSVIGMSLVAVTLSKVWVLTVCKTFCFHALRLVLCRPERKF